MLSMRDQGYGQRLIGRVRPTGWLLVSSRAPQVQAAARMHRSRFAMPGVADLPVPSCYRKAWLQRIRTEMAGLARDQSRGDALVNCRPHDKFSDGPRDVQQAESQRPFLGEPGPATSVSAIGRYRVCTGNADTFTSPARRLDARPRGCKDRGRRHFHEELPCPPHPSSHRHRCAPRAPTGRSSSAP